MTREQILATAAELHRCWSVLDRIRDAHRPRGPKFMQFCLECGHAWPCPTNAWTFHNDRDPAVDPWDPADDQEVRSDD